MQDMNDTEADNNATVVVSTVTDNDDDDDNVVDTAAQQQELQQEKLRIAAEKRRQRILQQANTRMSIVEGTYSSSATTGSSTTIDPVPTTIDENKVEDITTNVVINVDGTQADTSKTEPFTTTEEVEAPATTNTASTTSSSKLAAMRRRRFQKKTTAVTTTTAALGSELASTEEMPSTATTSMVEEHGTTLEVEDTKDTIIEVSIDAPTDISNPIIVDPITDTTPMTGPLDEHAVEDVATTSTKTSASKKYLGVAKMRRRMNKERQEQQEGQTSTTDHMSSSGGIGSSATRDNSKMQESLPPKKARSMVLSLPIIMYAITTTLLFLSGLQVGLQQSTIQYCYSNSTIQGDTTATLSEDGYCISNSNSNSIPNDEQWTVTVHSELAPRKMGGLQRVLSIMNVLPTPVVNQDEEKTTKMLKKPTLAEPVRQDTVSVEDEFAFTTGNSNHNSNIDPLFQVDLDTLTAGDGFYFALARFAVRVHRTILRVIFYTPLSIIQSILSIFYSFIQTPPTLFVFAVLIRHGIGKFVLGAKLPETVIDETQHKDILSTVKAFVMKFILSSFPTITVLYDVWTHIRSDMYVMLCGLFVGLALSHHHQASSPYGEYGSSKIGSSSMTSDEL